LPAKFLITSIEIPASFGVQGPGEITKNSGFNLFNNLNNPLNATRYHSLVAEQSSLPDCFEMTAWTQDEQGDIFLIYL
jgi:anthranilate/para-aminobenzoate synthase component II